MPLALEPFLVDRNPFKAVEEGIPLVAEVGNLVVKVDTCLDPLVSPLVAIKVDNPALVTEEDIAYLGLEEDNQPYFGLMVDTCWGPFILKFEFMI